jgi:recombination protein RecR
MKTTAIDRLITEIAKLPGIGPRSARRLTLNLLRTREQRIPSLVSALSHALEQVKTCSICGSLDDRDPCGICHDDRRNTGVILVVEDVADVWAMERSGAFRGRYHVLGGTLSAMDGRGPDALRIDTLLARAQENACSEIILALSATMAGQTTAHYIAERLHSLTLADAGSGEVARAQPLTITRLAQGIPMGGELDYMDDGTLGAALSARVAY